jgi:hypothetical protein
MDSINSIRIRAILTSRPLLSWYRFTISYSVMQVGTKATRDKHTATFDITSPVYSHVAGNVKSHLAAPVLPQWLKLALLDVFKKHSVLSNPQPNHGRAIDMFLWPARTPHFAVIQRRNYCLLWRTPRQDTQQHTPRLDVRKRAAYGLHHTLTPCLGLPRITLIRYSSHILGPTSVTKWRTDAAGSENFRYWEQLNCATDDDDDIDTFYKINNATGVVTENDSFWKQH